MKLQKFYMEKKNQRNLKIQQKKLFLEVALVKIYLLLLIKGSLLKSGINIIDFINSTKILNSKSEIRRLINEKGIKINDAVVENDKKIISMEDLNNDYIKVSHGKKKHFKIKLD